MFYLLKLSYFMPIMLVRRKSFEYSVKWRKVLFCTGYIVNLHDGHKYIVFGKSVGDVRVNFDIISSNVSIRTYNVRKHPLVVPFWYYGRVYEYFGN